MKEIIKDYGKIGITVEEDKFNPDKDYEKLTIVEDENGNIYLSRKDVPAELHIDLTNKEYWFKISGNGGGSSLPSNYIVDEEGLYIRKDGKIYPTIHPDLSTQPSILPQRFGNLRIYEVIIYSIRPIDIPLNASILSCFYHLKDSRFYGPGALQVNGSNTVWELLDASGKVITDNYDYAVVTYVIEDEQYY